MCETTKSNEKSVALRVEGNEFYSRRKFFDALIKYNQSLCFAEFNSENLGLAFANRSAVYFEMRLFNQCLKNMKLARENRYPERNFDILRKREEKCKDLQGGKLTSNPRSFFKLSHPPNKKLPFIVDCLEVKCDQKYGRYVTTNRSLKVGEIVSIEQPFCGVLLSDSKFLEVPEANIFQRCSNCLTENALDLLPCRGCGGGMKKGKWNIKGKCS